VNIRTARSGPYLFFVLASLAVLMSSIDNTIVAVAIPQLTTAFDAPLVWIGWTITAYQLVQLVMMPVAGRLSDTLGRKRIFLCSIGLFTLGSLLCGLAPSIGWLIAARAIQAVGGGGIMPSAMGIISDQFNQAHRAQARGLFSSIFPVGAIVGPSLGGFILHVWSWHALFFINVPLGVVVILGVWLLLRESRPASGDLHVDVVGIGQFAGAILVLMLGMTAIGTEPGWLGSPWLWALLAASVGLAVLFVRHVRTAPEPLVRYELLAQNPFLAVNLYNFFYGAAAIGFSSFVPYYAVVQYGMSPFESGAVLTPRSVTSIVVATLASLYVIRLGYRLPMVGGVLIRSLGLVLLGQGWSSIHLGPVELSGFWLIAAIIGVSGVGIGLSAPSSSNAGLDLAPREAAALTGLRGMFRQTGGAIGTAAIVLALSFFPDKAHGLSVIFIALAGVMLLTIPLAFMIPDTAHEEHLARQRQLQAEQRLA
jgi:EmrB/QacA subfamily drug resistance transporter